MEGAHAKLERAESHDDTYIVKQLIKQYLLDYQRDFERKWKGEYDSKIHAIQQQQTKL